MTIGEYLVEHPELDIDSFWAKVRTQYSERCNEESTLTNFMFFLENPFWEVCYLYDIAFAKGVASTLYEFMVETPYDSEFSAWLIGSKINEKVMQS